MQITGKTLIVLTFRSALVLFCLYVEKYEVKRCKTLVFYSFACQYCNDSFVFSYLEVRTIYIFTHTHKDTCLHLRTFEV